MRALAMRREESTAARAPLLRAAGRGNADRDSVVSALDVISELSPRELERFGYHLQRNDYYSALNDIAFLDANRDLWQGKPMPAGVPWDLDAQLAAVAGADG